MMEKNRVSSVFQIKNILINIDNKTIIIIFTKFSKFSVGLLNSCFNQNCIVNKTTK